MKKTYIETFFGGVVLLVAIGFLAFAYNRGDVATDSGYSVFASFDRVDGLSQGMEVRMSGIKIGKIKNISLNTDTYQAKLEISVSDDIKLPTDTVAQISTEGLLGGHYLALVPGAEEEYLTPGGSIVYTQPSVNLIQMLSKFMFSSGNNTNASQ